MPLTPSFTLSQTPSHITATIHTPHLRVNPSNLEIVILSNEFHFYCHPYLLHLAFPHDLVDDDDHPANATYDPMKNHGTIVVTVPKKVEGTHFKDLDLITKLMATKTGANKMITTLADDDGNDDDDDDDDDDGTNNEGGDATTTVTPQPDSSPSPFNELRPKYGFCQLFCDIFRHKDLSFECTTEGYQIDDLATEERREYRLESENNRFDPDCYLADCHITIDDDDDGIYTAAVMMTPHWMTTTTTTTTTSTTMSKDPDSYFTPEERDHLTRIPHRKIPSHALADTDITDSFFSSTKSSLLLGLFDILIAYAYDHRTTDGDPTCESAWTIRTLSPLLSWLESYDSNADSSSSSGSKGDTVRDVMTFGLRRMLIYPLIRNWDLGMMVVRDAVAIVGGGRRRILRCLLTVRAILDRTTESYYLLNTIYVDWYCVWIQEIDERVIDEFITELNEIMAKEPPTKDSLDLDLVMLEQAAFESADDDDTTTESLSDGNYVEDSDDEDDESNSDSDDDSVQNDQTLLHLESPAIIAAAHDNSNTIITSMDRLSLAADGVVDGDDTINHDVTATTSERSRCLIQEIS